MYLFLKKLFFYTLIQIYLIRTAVKGTDTEPGNAKPNIIIFLADDMGWNDVSFHGSNVFQTPNIDALAYNGIILHDFHTPSLCTPSRSALLTGKFPIFTGMQRVVILEAEPWGLPLNLKIFPQYLNSVGYDSQIVGKWHLGFHKKEFTPSYRGFKSHFGNWQGHIDYYSHICHETFGFFKGYDFRYNMEERDDVKDIYTTDLLTQQAIHIIENRDKNKPLFLLLSHNAPHAGEPNEPLQAPPSEIEKFSFIENEKKQKYAAMVSKLDESIGQVVKALHEQDMLRNSIIMFVSDNGAPTIGIHANTGSCHPFRGMKATEFEGGTRVPAIIWSPLLKTQQKISNIMMHMVDVLPTLATPAGVPPESLENIDGLSMWAALNGDSDENIRTQYPYNIDPSQKLIAYGAVRSGDFKYYQGSITAIGKKYGWVGDTGDNSNLGDHGYIVKNILDSEVHKAISDLYVKKEGSDKVPPEFHPQQPLTEEKILELRSKTKIVCRENTILPKCDRTKTCLLNLKEDPCERYDFSTVYPEKMKDMETIFELYRRQVQTPLNKLPDPCANPNLWNNHWVNWNDFELSVRNFSIGGIICKLKRMGSAIISQISKAISTFSNEVSNIFERWFGV